MGKKAIVAKDGAKPGGHYPQAILSNDFVFVSGQGPIDPETGSVIDAPFSEQVSQTITNIETILCSAGLSLDDIVKVNTFLADRSGFEEYDEVYQRHFPSNPPARTTISGVAISVPIELDCIAAVPRDAQE